MAFVAVLAMLAWFGAIVWLVCSAMELFDSPRFHPSIYLIAAAVLFALPFGLASAFSGDNPNANRLCLSGYEKWVSVHHAGYFVGGKVYIPAHNTIEKRWFCSEWDVAPHEESR